MAFDVSKLETVLTQVTDPATLTKLRDFLAKAKDSPAIDALEARWPGFKTFDEGALKVLDFLLTLDTSILPFLPAIFKVLDTLFPKAA